MKRLSRAFAVLALLFVLIFCLSCSSSSDEGQVNLPDGAGETDGDAENPADGDLDSEELSEALEQEVDPEDIYSPFWDAPDDAGIVELLESSSFFAERSWLLDESSSWFEDIVHEEAGEVPGESSRLGYYAVGNGQSFGFVGSYYPRNTLHGMIGPYYQKHGNSGFFSDFSAMLLEGEKLLPWKREIIWKPLKAQVPLTRMQVKGSQVELHTLTFAPNSSDGKASERTIVQVINVSNPSAEAVSGIKLLLQSYSTASADDGAYLEQAREERQMRVTSLDSAFIVAESPLEKYPAFVSGELSLAAGEEKQFVVVYEFAVAGDELGEATQNVIDEGWEKLLEETRQWWRLWHDSGLHVHSADRRVNDLIEGLKGAVRSQVADNGAICPMSYYTSTWIRDSYGPTRMFLRFGYPDVAWGISDYYYKAAAKQGNIGNAIHADIDISGDVPPVDWMSNTPFSGRLRGEGPSHIPLMHALYWRYTGDGDGIAARWDYLMHTLKGQEVTPEGLMYFSGDETFRPALSTNLALEGGAEYKFEDLTYSANSAFLYVRACETLAAYANEYGLESADIAWLESEAQRVRQLTDAAYWLDEEQRYSPFIYMDNMQPETRPAEDVNTQPLWLSYLSPDDDKARSNIKSTMDEILQDNGILQNRNGETLEVLGYQIGQGIMSGMAPAYFLYNVTELNLDLADKTFDALGQYVSPSGNYPEVGVFAAPGRALCLIYSRNGWGETWARHRQWEGAISAEALMHHLIGFEADVPAGFISVAPHLPHDSAFIEAENMIFNDHALSMRFEHNASGFKLTMNCQQDPASFELSEYRLRIFIPFDNILEVKVDSSTVTDYDLVALPDGVAEVRLTLLAKQGESVVEFVE